LPTNFQNVQVVCFSDSLPSCDSVYEKSRFCGNFMDKIHSIAYSRHTHNNTGQQKHISSTSQPGLSIILSRKMRKISGKKTSCLWMNKLMTLTYDVLIKTEPCHTSKCFVYAFTLYIYQINLVNFATTLT